MASTPKGQPDRISLFQALMERADPDLLNAKYDAETGKWIIPQSTGSVTITPDPDVAGAYLIGE